MAKKSLCACQFPLRCAKKRLFPDFRGPKYALLTPLLPLKALENHPFCAHFRALSIGYIARNCPRPVAAGFPRHVALPHWHLVPETCSPLLTPDTTYQLASLAATC